MPNIAYEEESRAVPVNYRRCRSTACGDAPDHGLVRHTDRGLPVAAFVHVVDCRAGESDGIDCSGDRAGHLYIQYWTYYADSATFRGIPILGDAGYHPDDWEGVQIRIDSDGRVDERASSHNGYNYAQGVANWGSDAGIDPLRDLAEAVGVRAANGWGPETHWLFVSGGSHAGNAKAFPDLSRITKSGQVHLIPLEPIAAADVGNAPGFAISPPWMKRVWRDPEAEGTD